jgi:hypothetical protein
VGFLGAGDSRIECLLVGIESLIEAPHLPLQYGKVEP